MKRRSYARVVAGVAAGALGAVWLAEPAAGQAGGSSADAACVLAAATSPLPAELVEVTGMARGRSDTNVFWFHNDVGGEREFFAVSGGGSLLGRVEIDGALLEDWEDLESGPCAGGDCLFLVDTDDKAADRDLTIYTIPEPDPRAGSATATTHWAAFPDGRFDSKALFVLPDGGIYVVTTGYDNAAGAAVPAALYRYPGTPAPLRSVTLERVRELFPAGDRDRTISAASASPDGRWVAMINERSLYIYPAAELVGAGPAAPIAVDLDAFGEKGRDGVAIADDGTVWIATEPVGAEGAPAWARLSCTLEGR